MLPAASSDKNGMGVCDVLYALPRISSSLNSPSYRTALNLLFPTSPSTLRINAAMAAAFYL